MSTKPHDTSANAWRIRQAVLLRMDGEARMRAAIDLSESVRELQIEGLLGRNPSWGRAQAVRYLVLKQWAVDLAGRA